MNKFKLSLFDLTLISVLSGTAISLNFIDSFIPHVHPMHKIFLILIISIIGFYRGLLLIIAFTILGFVIKGVNFVLFWQQGLIMLFANFSFLFSSIIKMLKKDSKIMILLIIFLTFIFFYFIKASSDTYYTIESTHNFWKSFYLAIIWPGEWLDALISFVGTLFTIFFIRKTIENQYIKYKIVNLKKI